MKKQSTFQDISAYAHKLVNLKEKEIMIEIIKICAEQENEADRNEKNFLTIENALKDKIDTNDFDVLIQTSAQLIRHGQALPFNLAKFVADVLEKNALARQNVGLILTEILFAMLS